MSAVLSWLVTRDNPDEWDIEWNDLMLIRFPDNTGTIIAGVMIVVGLVMLRRARHAARTLTQGTAASATVLEVTDTGTRINHQPRLKLRLSVAVPG